jgi:hypothetical protein
LPLALAHIVQEGSDQQVTIIVLLCPKGVEYIQAVALVASGHPLKKLNLGWGQVYAYQTSFVF